MERTKPLKYQMHRVTMPEDIALKYLDELLKLVNKQFLDPGFPIALSMATDALRRTAEHDKAMEEGRLVELPCKVGDTVYTRNHHGRIVDGVVQSIHQNFVAGVAGRWVVTVYYPEYNGTAGSGLSDDFLSMNKYHGLVDFGKTVFLTRPEAEAALHGGGAGED